MYHHHRDSTLLVTRVVIPGLLRSRVMPETRVLPMRTETAALRVHNDDVPPWHGTGLMISVKGQALSQRWLLFVRCLFLWNVLRVQSSSAFGVALRPRREQPSQWFLYVMLLLRCLCQVLICMPSLYRLPFVLWGYPCDGCVSQALRVLGAFPASDCWTQRVDCKNCLATTRRELVIGGKNDWRVR